MTKRHTKPEGKKTSHTLSAKPRDDESLDMFIARMAIGPGVRHASTAATFAAPLFGENHETSIDNNLTVLEEVIARGERGDKAFAGGILAAQAVTLDAIFTELARRSAINAGSHMHATERYMRLALKAQSNCRATLEALAKLHQPREQTVKHVQVNEGGQAVVADQIHQHGGQNEKSDKQSHATRAAGKSPEMLSQDPQGNGMPITSGKGQEAV